MQSDTDTNLYPRKQFFLDHSEPTSSEIQSIDPTLHSVDFVVYNACKAVTYM